MGFDSEDESLEKLKIITLITSDSMRNISFSIKWIDLWLFDQGIGIVSIKCQLDGGGNISDQAKAGSNLNKLSSLNRFSRSFRECPAEIEIGAENSVERMELWKDLVFGRLIGQDSHKSFTPISGICCSTDDLIDQYVDRNTRYARLLTLAQIKLVENSANYNSKEYELKNIPVIAQDATSYFNSEIDKDENSASFADYPDFTVSAQMSGFTTQLDHLVYELSSCSEIGTS